MPLSPNTLGQMYALTVLTPIAPGAEPALRGYLEGLGEGESPLARLPRTHFGRWVILPDYHSEKDQKPDHLASQYLVFTSNFDGDRDSYLDELCDKLAPEAAEIWGRCYGCPQPARGDALKHYLIRNHITTGFFVAAYGKARVEQVKAAIAQRTKVSDFAVATQGASPQELQSRFKTEFGG